MGIEKPPKGGWQSDHPVPPGRLVEETIDARGISQQDLASRLRWSQESVTDLLQGRLAVTPEVAEQLERVLELSAQWLLNIEASYRGTLAKGKARTA